MGYTMSWERETSEEKFESIQHGYEVIEEDFEEEMDDDEPFVLEEDEMELAEAWDLI